jgi:galactokinase
VTPAERAAALFSSAFGTAHTQRWAAPGRVNLIGEHTDYNDGFVLPFALPHLTAVAAGPQPDGAPHWTVRSEHGDETVELDELTPGTPDGWAAYVAGVIWALREAGHDIPGARLAIASDVPIGAGLSSSAAIECAVLGALVDLAGVSLPAESWPRLAQRAENAYVGVPSGIMDQSASTLCREGHALFLDCRSLAVEHVPLDLRPQGMAVLVIDSKAPHRHTDGEYADRRRSCEQAARELGVSALRDVDLADLPKALEQLPDDTARRRVRHVVTEDQRVLDTVEVLRAGDVRAVGPLMTASHASMRDDYEITVPEIDAAVEAANDAGAYGARMTGGGFGGCVLALADTDRLDGVRAAVRDRYAKAGYHDPEFFVAVPSPGAHRV